ncbi:KilA-N domain-containing protein [Nitrosomonas aestuarii]|nr:KilA-N domain-containing protein [Nitrosomonas aestuarii]
MANLTILSKEIRQVDGLYSLNDLHKAAGGESKHQPSNFLRIETTQALIDEIQSSEMRSAKKTINGGIKRGTYVCRELVYAYAMWISPKFHLHVIRAFDQISQHPVPLSSKQYHYPHKRLEQPFFTSSGSVSLSVSMLADTRNFTSQLMQLLNELRTDGHNIDAAWEEFIAMRDGIINANKFLEDVNIMAIKPNIKPNIKPSGGNLKKGK